MKHDDLDKRVTAYIDGVLRGPKRERLEREFATDPHLARQVDRSRALGRLVRDAWNEGPAAPSPDFLLVALRPALAEIDRERNARPAWQRAVDGFFARFAASLRPSPALATAAAFAFVAALTLIPRFDLSMPVSIFAPGGSPELAPPPVTRASSSSMSIPLFPSQQVDFSAEGSTHLQDAAPGHPAVLWRGKDGSQTLWLIEPGGLSFLLDTAEGWG